MRFSRSETTKYFFEQDNATNHNYYVMHDRYRVIRTGFGCETSSAYCIERAANGLANDS